MKTLHSLRFLFILFAAFSFSCNDEKVPVDILTFSADLINFGGTSENWVIAWNNDGEVLDYKPYTLNEKLVLSTTGKITDNKIVLGLVSYEGGTDKTNCLISIYNEIPVGTEFNRKFLVTDYPAPNGPFTNFTFDLESPDPQNYLYMTNKLGDIALLADKPGPYEGSLHPAFRDYNVMIRSGGVLKHKFIADIKPGDNITLAEDDFVPYENELTFQFPEGVPTIFFNGFADGVPLSLPGYALDAYYESNSVTSLKTGYPDFVSKFNIHLSVSTPSGFMTYQKIGSLPGAIDWPNPALFTVANKSVKDFEISVGPGYRYSYSFWFKYSADGSTQVEVSSPLSSPIVPELPDEILSKHPKQVKVEAADFMQSHVYLGAFTYDQYLDFTINSHKNVESEWIQLTLF